MNTQDWEARIDDYVDGLMAPSEAAAFEAAMAEDASLREAVQGLRALLSAAKALPREAQPDRDLWSGIAERLQDRTPARRHTDGVSATHAHPHRRWAWWAAPAMAAAFACVFIGGLVARDVYTTQGPVPPGQTAAVPPALEDEFAQVDADYAAAREALVEALKESDLPASTVETFTANLDIIDAAIAETRLAMQQNPENGQLVRSLVASYDRKRQLIQDATQWPVEMEAVQ